MGHKKYKERRLPSFHKNDAIAFYAAWHDEWWDTKSLPSKCWKDQSKRRHQYKKIRHFDLTGRECNCILVPPTMTVDEFNELVYLVNTYPALFA